MLSAEDNRFLTQSDAGTGMGELIRRFWVPAILSEEVPKPDGEPKKITLLGEELLAFRDTEGRVGVIDQYCPHRGTNLWLGRNEECGIRCVYHGWKFDVTRPVRRHADELSRSQRQGRHAHQGVSGARIRGHRLGLHGAGGYRSRSCRTWNSEWCRRRIGSSRRNGRTVTGCRRSKGRSTRRISPIHTSFSTNRRDEDLDVDKHLVMPIARMTGNLTKWIAKDPRPVIQVGAA